MPIKQVIKIENNKPTILLDDNGDIWVLNKTTHPPRWERLTLALPRELKPNR